jgi:hypothetical protein
MGSDSSTATSLDDFLGTPRGETELKRPKSCGGGGELAAADADEHAEELEDAKISIFDSSMASPSIVSPYWQKETNEEDKLLKRACGEGLRRHELEGFAQLRRHDRWEESGRGWVRREREWVGI